MAEKTPSRSQRLHDAKPQQATQKALERDHEGKERRKASSRPSRQPAWRIVITRHAVRCLDADNFAGGCKGLIDAIRRAKFIPDDDPATVLMEFHQRSAKKHDERMEVEIFTLVQKPQNQKPQ